MSVYADIDCQSTGHLSAMLFLLLTKQVDVENFETQSLMQSNEQYLKLIGFFFIY